MSRSRAALRAASALAAVSAVTLLGVSSAAAVPLPADDALYAVEASDDTLLQLFSVDSVDAALTTIGSGASIDGSYGALQPAWNQATGLAYYITFSAGRILTSVDVSTGVSTAIAPATAEGASINLDTVAIRPDGSAFATQGDTLYSLDLATAIATPIGVIDAGTFFRGFSANPVTGELIGFGPSGEIRSIDATTGVGTVIGQLDIAHPWNIFAGQVDSDGNYWLANLYFDSASETYESELVSVASSDLDFTRQGFFDGGLVDSQVTSLFLVPGDVAPAPAPGPALAATGTGDATGLVALSVLLLVAGALAVLRTRAARNES